MKTIVLITTSYPSVNDGSEAAGSFVKDFAEELSKHAKVIVLAPGKSISEVLPSNSLQVKRYAGAKKPLSLLKISKSWHWLSIIKILRSGGKVLEETIKE